jgi:hypothetical protein
MTEGPDFESLLHLVKNLSYIMVGGSSFLGDKTTWA